MRPEAILSLTIAEPGCLAVARGSQPDKQPWFWYQCNSTSYPVPN
jgi:hypothetical protein